MYTSDIHPGTIIERNIGRRFVYQVMKVDKQCTCPDPMDWYEGRKQKPTRSHYHLTLKQLYPIEQGMNIQAWIGWVELRDEEWRSIFDRFQNKIEFKILEQPKEVQLSLFG